MTARMVGIAVAAWLGLGVAGAEKVRVKRNGITVLRDVEVTVKLDGRIMDCTHCSKMSFYRLKPNTMYRAFLPASVVGSIKELSDRQDIAINGLDFTVEKDEDKTSIRKVLKRNPKVQRLRIALE